MRTIGFRDGHVAPDTDLLEYACLENEKDVAHFPGR